MAAVERVMAMAERPQPPAAACFPPPGAIVYAFRWRTRKQLPERYGDPCRIVHKSRTASVSWRGLTVEFQDGTRINTTRGCIRLSTPILDRHEPG